MRESLSLMRPLAPTLLCLLPSILGAQTVTKTLARPEVEFAEPFSTVAAIRELRDGRVLIADTKDKVVQLVDLKAQKGTKVGREGSGPGEYGLPMQMVGLPGDTSIVFDPINSRYLTVLPDGKPGATFRLEDGAPPPPPAPASGGPVIRAGGIQTLMAPRAVDAAGRLYFEGSPISFGPNGPVAADSAPVMRYDRKTHRYDTLTFVQLPKNSASIQTSNSGGNQNVNVRIGSRAPFAARDMWAVLPNGTVAVVRVKDYHVDLIAPSRQVVRGAPVPYTPVRVGEAEKQEYRESQRANAPIAISRTNDNGRITTGTTAPKFEEPAEWPAVKPAFTGALASPTGEIWVARSRTGKDEIPKYDVFSPAGKLTGTVALPKRTRIVGFGNGGAIYTIRSDEDELQYLQRFRG